MKILYGGAPLKSTRFHCYDTNDATVVPSDLHVGVTAWAKGKKIVGTGRAFEFACYGGTQTNLPEFIPDAINIVHIGSPSYPIRMTMALNEMKSLDFTTSPQVAEVTINDVAYPITVKVVDGEMTVICDQIIDIQLFYGKDRYV